MSGELVLRNGRRSFGAAVLVCGLLLLVAMLGSQPFAGAMADVDVTLLNYRVEPLGSNAHYTGVHLADMTADGLPELLIGNRDTSSLEIWAYDPVLDTMIQIDSVPFPYHIHDLKAADYDHDGDMDVAVGMRGNYGLYYLINTGAPGTVGSWAFEAKDLNYSWQVLADDFDSDGHLDLFHAIDYGPIHTFYGRGDGLFPSGADVADPDTEMRFPRGFNAVDLNEDGLLDLIGVDGSFMRAFLNPDARDEAWASVGPDTPVGDYPCCDTVVIQADVSPSAADLNGDGFVDQVAFRGRPSDGPLDILLFAGGEEDGDLTWTVQTIDSVWGDEELVGMAAHAGVADLNGDGYLDIHVGGGQYFNNLLVYLGDGTGDWFKQVIPLDHGVGGLNSFAVADLNGDGAVDIVTTRYTEEDGANSGFEVLYGPRPRGERFVRVSERPGSGQTNGESRDPAMSGDGRYVVYVSEASNLFGNLPEYGFEGLFIHDRVTDGTAVISLDDEDSFIFRRPSVSATGDYVAYEEEDIDSPEYTDIYIWERASGKRILVGEEHRWEANDELLRPAISGDGRLVAFESAASNLVEGDTNEATDIFLFDRETEETVRLSLGVAEQIAAEGHNPSLSADGQRVLYETLTFYNMEYICPAIVFHDRPSGETKIIAEDDCDQGDYTVHEPVLAGGGQYAVYIESCYECAPQDIIDTLHVVGLDGQPGYTISNDDWWPDQTTYPLLAEPSVSADGRFVAFTVEFQSEQPDSVYLYDRQTDTMTALSVSSDGATANGPSSQPALAANGRAVAFRSAASNLIAQDTNGYDDVFRRDFGPAYELVRPLGVVDAGEYHTCALTSRGRAVCWGADDPQDDHGQAEDRDGPFTQVGAGATHSCGLGIDGNVTCWGNNDYGQAEDQTGPFVQLAVGGDSNCALRADGSFSCWGREQTRADTDAAGPFSQLSVGFFHTCGLTPAGDVDCWGYNEYGQAEDADGPFTQVVTGYWHTCALRVGGEAVCWGENLHGQAQNQPGPFQQLAAGSGHNCGLRPDNSVACWGDNWFGAAEDQLGPYVQISAHYAHTCALTPDGRVDCWGWNEDGQAASQIGPFGPFRALFYSPMLVGN